MPDDSAPESRSEPALDAIQGQALYTQDFYAWTQEQAARLAARDADGLDFDHLAEEITSLGKSEQRQLYDRLIVLLEHLLKLSIAHASLLYVYERNRRGGQVSCRTQRARLAKVLRDNPSLTPTVPDELTDAYVVARLEAAQALGIDEALIPAPCPWSVDQVLDPDFFSAP
jgi:hypothetical protein